MWWNLAADVLILLALVVLWYWGCVHMARNRARLLLGAIESAFAGHGHISSVHWLSASEFQVRLRLPQCGFAHPSVVVRMSPRENPIKWLYQFIRRVPETLTFEANLLCRPSFNLDVHNRRWSPPKNTPPRNRDAQLKANRHTIGPFVICSRIDWQREITSMMHALSASRDCEFLRVSFRRNSPHFSATVPLITVAERRCSPVRIFDALRELAAGASTAKF